MQLLLKSRLQQTAGVLWRSVTYVGLSPNVSTMFPLRLPEDRVQITDKPITSLYFAHALEKKSFEVVVKTGKAHGRFDNYTAIYQAHLCTHHAVGRFMALKN
ncbi:hypothetical protein SLE2022_178900 [Rubroshorea leprosula]